MRCAFGPDAASPLTATTLSLPPSVPKHSSVTTKQHSVPVKVILHQPISGAATPHMDRTRGILIEASKLMLDGVSVAPQHFETLEDAARFMLNLKNPGGQGHGGTNTFY